MNTSLKVTKYQLYYAYKGVAIFYSIIVMILFGIVILSRKWPEGVTFGGLGMATVIFIYIAGLDWFKSSFRFAVANNVPRKKFYHGTIFAMMALTVFMAFVDTVISAAAGRVISYESIAAQLYGTVTYPAEFLWSLGLYALSVCLGWLTTVMYYRAGKAARFVIFAAPVVFLILFEYIDRRTGRALSGAVIGFVQRAMGFAYNNNPLIGFLSLITGATAILLFSYLFIRRAPVRD